MITKNDLLNLTLGQLKQLIVAIKEKLNLAVAGKNKEVIVDTIYALHNDNKFYGKKLLGYDGSMVHIVLPERKNNMNKSADKAAKRVVKEEKLKKEEEAKSKVKQDIKKRLKKVTDEKVKAAEIARATTVYLETVRESREAEQRLNDINKRIASRKK